MAYFATLGSAHKACLTDRKGRKIIVQHKGVFLRAVQTFNQLCISNRTQRSNNQCLSLATRKQRRPVRFRQNAGFHFDGTNSRRIAAVDSWRPVKNAVAHSPLLKCAEGIRYLSSRRPAFLTGKRFDRLLLDLTDSLISLHFFRDLVRLGNGGAKALNQSILKRGVFCLRLPIPCRLAGFCFQLIDCVYYHLHFLMCKKHGAQHLIFTELLGLRLNHQYRRLRTRNHHVQQRTFQSLIVRIEYISMLRMIADASSTNGFGEWNS